MTDTKSNAIRHAFSTIPHGHGGKEEEPPELYGLLTLLDAESLESLTTGGFFSDWRYDKDGMSGFNGIMTDEYSNYGSIVSSVRALSALGVPVPLDKTYDSEDASSIHLDSKQLETLKSIGSYRYVLLCIAIERMLKGPRLCFMTEGFGILLLTNDRLEMDTDWLIRCIRSALTGSVTGGDGVDTVTRIQWLHDFASDVLRTFRKHVPTKDWSSYIDRTVTGLNEAMMVPYDVWRTRWIANHGDDVPSDWPYNPHIQVRDRSSRFFMKS